MKNPIIKLNVKDYGTIVAELYPEKAPKTVENFVKLVEDGFFSGLIFHRVIAGFIQKRAASIYGEFAANGFPQNDLKHERGTLSMARTSVPNSASSQFFVMHADAPYLDGQYAAFGQVIEGIEVVDKIASVRTRSLGYYDDVPASPVVIESAELVAE